MYPSGDESVAPLESLFRTDITHRDVLLKPSSDSDRVSGFINTIQGPALVESSPILHSNDSRPVAVIWFTLKSMMISPIERLTFILQTFLELNRDREDATSLSDMVSALGHLRNSMSQSSKRDEISKLVKAFQGLSIPLREATSEIWRIAHIEELTGLANRRLFLERLESEIVVAPKTIKKLQYSSSVLLLLEQ